MCSCNSMNACSVPWVPVATALSDVPGCVKLGSVHAAVASFRTGALREMLAVAGAALMRVTRSLKLPGYAFRYCMMVGHPTFLKAVPLGPGAGATNDCGASDGAFVVMLGASALLVESL